jgi:hypothetical protein
MSTPTAPKRPKQRTLSITFTIDGQSYTVSPLDCEPEIGDRAFRFHKQGRDGAVYDLYHGRYGWACQCLGFERYGYCRHSQALMKAAQLFGTAKPAGGRDVPQFIEVLSPARGRGDGGGQGQPRHVRPRPVGPAPPRPTTAASGRAMGSWPR